MKLSKNLSLLLDSLLNFLNSRKDIKEFCDPLPNKFEFKSVKPKSKPVKKLINKNLLQSNALSNQLIKAVINACDDLCWNTTYTKEQVGADFLMRYGWFDIISANGPFVTDNLRIMIGYWGDGLDYQLHWHLAEEAYIPISGSALFWSESMGQNIYSVGDIVINKSNEKHWTKMTNGPLLAIAIWKGSNLRVNPVITSRDGKKIHNVKENIKQ